MGAISANSLDLTGRVATAAMTRKPTMFCCSDIPLIYTSDMKYIIRYRKKHSKLSVRTSYLISPSVWMLYNRFIIWKLQKWESKEKERERKKIPFKLLIWHSPDLSIKGRVIVLQSVVTPTLKNLIYRKRLKELGLERGNLVLSYVTSELWKGLLTAATSLFCPACASKAKISEYKMFEVRSK